MRDLRPQEVERPGAWGRGGDILLEMGEWDEELGEGRSGGEQRLDCKKK